MVENGRIKKWKAGVKGEIPCSLEDAKVVYWMQSAQRTVHNHALAYAIERANAMHLPLTVVFCMMPNFPNANSRHFRFMLEGLAETTASLAAIGCGFQWYIGETVRFLSETCRSAALLVMDDAYLKYERMLKSEVMHAVSCEVVQVFTNVIVPVELAYPRAAYGAYVLRPHLHRMMPAYDNPFQLPALACRSPWTAAPLDISVMDDIACEPLAPSACYTGGFSKALARLEHFINEDIAQYAQLSNDPDRMLTSGLSPYLHFGQISPMTILEQIRLAGVYDDAFSEQLVVRRELALNYVFYEPDYALSLAAILPSWAMETLAIHSGDVRDYCYTCSDFEHAKTHDNCWNAAQRQLVSEGIIHNYMRMYWGKKIIEWSQNPDDAFQTMLYLNDKYALDGRDPNGYAGIAWCFGKHDRPWQERVIFGKVRYMNEAGLRRKFKMLDYLARYREGTE